MQSNSFKQSLKNEVIVATGSEKKSVEKCKFESLKVNQEIRKLGKLNKVCIESVYRKCERQV